MRKAISLGATLVALAFIIVIGSVFAFAVMSATQQETTTTTETISHSILLATGNYNSQLIDFQVTGANCSISGTATFGSYPGQSSSDTLAVYYQNGALLFKTLPASQATIDRQIHEGAYTLLLGGTSSAHLSLQC